jgi:HEPN domain-containing protein
MKPGIRSEVNERLQKAALDLRSACVLLDNEPPVLETACFHCQQAEKKGLKAYLVCRGVRFEKVHSLTYLLALCKGSELAFASLRDRIESLTPHAVEIRYPGTVGEISREED